MPGVLLLLMITLVGCNLAAPSIPTPTPGFEPTPTVAPEITPLQIGVWETLAPGLERRIDVPEGNELGEIVVLRIDPALYSFRAHYGEPLNLLQWRDGLPDAVALVNANFFEVDNSVLGLLIADGQVYGTPYTDRGGMFAIENGQPRIRSNIREPYQGEALEQAVQAFPLLVEDGQQGFTDTTGDVATRRTAVAIDAQGRVLLIVTPLLGLRLADLAAFLVQSDYGVVDVLNLDGGGSTMMLIRPIDFTLVSLDRVPVVLAVYAR